jgi:hypothetical protein
LGILMRGCAGRRPCATPRVLKNDLSVRVRERPAGLRLATCLSGSS